MALFPQFARTDAQLVAEMSVEQATERAIKLLRMFAPSDGYYLAFSGGKDSGTCKKLLEMAGVKFDAHYNNVTIDPPELVRFIKQHHPDAWKGRNEPEHGNMFCRISTANKVPPTRMVRWCCEEYKERGGDGRTKVIGVRAAESPKRKLNWREVTRDKRGNPAICPIVYWTDEQVWGLIRLYNVPYCSAYDLVSPITGKKKRRLGCVGCPLAGPEGQDDEFALWPKYEQLWKRSVIKNWEKWKDVPREDGKARFQSRFDTGESFWNWWRNGVPYSAGDDCQTEILWTND